MGLVDIIKWYFIIKMFKFFFKKVIFWRFSTFMKEFLINRLV